MLRSVWSKSLRDYRIAILAWGIGLGLLMIVAFATATPDILATFAAIVPLIRFLGDPYAIQTPAGYITFRYMQTVLPLILSFWPILASTRMVRGEEERGTMDVLLATPQTRTRLLVEKILALILALLLIALLIALGTITGEAKIGQVDAIRALLNALNLVSFSFFFGMLALLLSQLTLNRGVATGITNGFLLLALLFTVTGREISGSWLQYLSPFYYYNLNRPLIPGFQNQPLGTLLLLGLALLFATASVVLFGRRDIGRAAFSWLRKRANGTYQAERSLQQAEQSLSTRSVSLYTLFAQGWPAFWWLLGIVAFCVYSLFLIPGIQKAFYKLIQETPWLQQLFFDTPTNTNAALLGTFLFSFVPALVVAFAFALALSWSSDLENGRLELVFSTPQSRFRVLLERFGANLLVLLLAPILTWLTIMIGARLLNIAVNQERIVSASLSMLPPALIILTLVYALAGRLRHLAVLGLLTAYLVLAYLEETLEGTIKLPTWLMSLSIFHLYGNPIFLGMNWSTFLNMLLVAIALLGIALIQFRYIDLERG